MSVDPIHEVMPRVSRALANGDRQRAFRLLTRAVGPDVAAKAMDAFARKPLAPANTVLTPAEYAAVWNAACGLDVSEAAIRFHRGRETVRAHRRSAYRRLGVHTMAGAVAECYRRGIFDASAPLIPVDW